jgi:hypothetical protein
MISDEKFDTEEAAQEKADRLNKHVAPEKFCPLIKDTCRKDCVCWEPASVIDESGPFATIQGPFSIIGFHCTNVMFAGD